MAKPIQHNALDTVASEAEAGITRGIVGAIAGGLLATAAVAAIGALVATAAASVLSFGAVGTLGGAWTAAGAMVGAVATWVTPVGYAGAALGGGAGALGGMAKRGTKIQSENLAAQKVTGAHKMQMEAQLADVRAQAAEQYTQVGYAQGMQDGQMAIMQQLQAAQAQQEQMMMAQQDAPKEETTIHRDRIMNERGETPELAKDASHAEKALASKEGDNLALGA